MRGVHSHESRCLRGRQLRPLFIPSTLNCVLGPTRRHDTSNPTLQIILRASLAAAIFHQLWKLINSLNNRKRVPVARPVLSASFIFFWHVYFVILVPFSLPFLFLFVCVFLLLSLELRRCSSDLFLSSRPRTGLATTYITGYYG